MLNCSICGDVADLILALVEEDGTILLIDSITNQILTRIPTEKSIIRILFDTDSTGIFACTQDGNGWKCVLLSAKQLFASSFWGVGECIDWRRGH